MTERVAMSATIVATKSRLLIMVVIRPTHHLIAIRTLETLDLQDSRNRLTFKSIVLERMINLKGDMRERY
jgi:hypothetical protein